jgi:hypothetical protein
MVSSGKRVGRIVVQKRRGFTEVTFQAQGARGGFFSVGQISVKGGKPGDLVLALVAKTKERRASDTQPTIGANLNG